MYLKSAVAGLVSVLISSGTLSAQTGQTVDQYQLVPGLRAGAYDIGSDSDGVLYAVGTGVSGAEDTSVGVVRRSNDGGATWSTEDIYSDPDWTDLQYRAFGAGNDGALFVGGELWKGEPNTGTKTWIVRERVNGLWKLADELSTGEGGKPSCGDVKVHPTTRDVYAVGRWNAASDQGFYWLVRKRAAGATEFVDVDLQGAPPSNDARAVGFGANGAVFVVGKMGGPSRDIWTVRRSLDNGATWTTVDSYVETSRTYSEARCITVSSTGAIYVGGRAVQSVKGSLMNSWVVRRSLDNGNTWTTLDRFSVQPAPYGIGDASATGIAVDSSGAVYVTGITGDPGRMLVRKGVNVVSGKKSTWMWTTIDDYQLTPGFESNAHALTMRGNSLLTAGVAQYDSTGVTKWVVRKLNLQ